MAEWFKLDNAANFYPATMRRNWNSVFRVSATLTHEINAGHLEQAVIDLKPRFPSFYIQLRNGFFWHYFESVNAKGIVEKEKHYPCQPIIIGYGNKPVFRVLYFGKRISLEFFHAVTDGAGALVFLKALVCRYLDLCGFPMDEALTVVADARDNPIPEEYEDSFSKYYDSKMIESRKEPRAYFYNAKKHLDDRFLRVISGAIKIEDLKKITREKGVTLTQYLTALYIIAIANNMPRNLRRPHPIRVSVPVNLRKTFPSKTLRNFSLYANIGMKADANTNLDDVIKEVVKQFETGFDKDRLLRAFSTNVRPEKSFMVRLFPLWLKNQSIKLINTLYGESRFTTALSNMGQVEVPEQLGKHIESFECMLCGSPQSRINLSLLSFRDKMTLTFSSVSEENKVQAFFFQYLSSLGVEVEVTSNV